ncbi:MAG: hypothetical protein EHM28_07525 [Spirochaetaceae bacterium]|nr:MAG: hypothetical protein EHM28_07525 [Spirochaetaceae bacterium]
MKAFFEKLQRFQENREAHLSQARYLHHFLAALGIFLLLQDLLALNLQNSGLLHSIVKYTDEAIPLFLFILLVLSRIVQRRNIYRTPVDIPLIVFLLLAIVSSIVHQVGAFIIVSQFVIYIKGFMVFYLFYNLPLSRQMFHSYVKIFFVVGMIFLAFGFIDLLFPAAFRRLTGNDMFVEYRFSIPSIKSLFIHPGVFAWFMSFLALFCFAFAMIRMKSFYLLAGLLFFMGCFFSMRARSLIGLFVGLLVSLFFITGKKRLVILALLVPLLIFGIIFMGDALLDLFQTKMNVYVSSEDYMKIARNALYLKSFDVARDSFPLGAGMGRYGSHLSSIFYSPIYEKYGLSTIHGMTREKPNFITDTFWPMIVGETGYLGFALYLAILAIFIKMLANHIRNTHEPLLRAFHLGALMVVVKGIVESIADPVFAAPPAAIFLFAVVGLSAVIYRQGTHEPGLRESGRK